MLTSSDPASSSLDPLLRTTFTQLEDTSHDFSVFEHRYVRSSLHFGLSDSAEGAHVSCFELAHLTRAIFPLPYADDRGSGTALKLWVLAGFHGSCLR